MTNGELINVNLGKTDADGNLEEAARLRLLSSIQLGLTKLYKRFRLKEGEVTILLQDGVTRYKLKSDFAQSNTKSTEPVKYLDDSVDPFIDDLLKIEQVFDDEDKELLLNVKGNKDSLITVDTTTLYIPETIETQTVRVIYRKDHPKFDKLLAPALAFQQEVELPEAYLEPLLYFVASRIFTPMGLNQEFNEGKDYYIKYENACNRLETQGLVLDNMGEVETFRSRGWV